MFRRLERAVAPPAGVLTVEGSPVIFRAGDSVAAALLAAGHAGTRTEPVAASPRGPYCMMGVCFECLVEIDGEANRQACLVPARDGMVVRFQRGPRGLP